MPINNTLCAGGPDQDWFRESFSRNCFDALLQLSVATTRSGGVSRSSQFCHTCCSTPSFPVPSPPLSSLSVTGTGSSAAVLGHWVAQCRESLEVFSREESMSGGVPLPRARLTDVLTTLHSVVSLVATLQERQDRGGWPMHAQCVCSVIHTRPYPSPQPMQCQRCGLR